MRQCAVCGKGSIMGGTRKLLRGHYNLTKTERKYPNLQWAVLTTARPELKLKAGTRVKACARCIKKLSKV